MAAVCAFLIIEGGVGALPGSSSRYLYIRTSSKTHDLVTLSTNFSNFLHAALNDNCKQKSFSALCDWNSPSLTFCQVGGQKLTIFFNFVTFWPIFWTPTFPNPRTTLLDSSRGVCMQKTVLEKCLPKLRSRWPIFPQNWIFGQNTVFFWFFWGVYQGQKWLSAKSNRGLWSKTFHKNQRKSQKSKIFFFFLWLWGIFQKAPTSSAKNLELFCKAQETSKWVINGFTH